MSQAGLTPHQAAPAPRAVAARQRKPRHSSCGTGVWTRLRTGLPAASGRAEAQPRQERGHRSRWARPRTGLPGPERLPSAQRRKAGARPAPAGSTHHGAPVRLLQPTGLRRPDRPAHLTGQVQRWRETKTRELANPRGPAPEPGRRA